jgi:hypothetical protein
LIFDSARHEGDLETPIGLRTPVGHRSHVVFRHDAIAGVAKNVLEQDTNGERKPVQFDDPGFHQCVQPEDGDVAVGECQGRAGIESVGHGV